MTIRTIETVAEFESLVASSEGCEIYSDLTPMQDPIWLLSCAKVIAAERKFVVIAVDDDRGLGAFVALLRMRVLRYEQLGARDLFEPGGSYFVDEGSLDTLVDAVARLNGTVDLGRMFAGSMSLDAMKRVAERRGGKFRARSSGACPYIEIPSDIAEIDELLPSRLRSDLRRAKRKADAIGPVSFETVAPSSKEQFLVLYEHFLEIEAASWKGRTGTALAIDQRRQEFYREYGLSASKKGILRIGLMRVGDRIVAMQYAVQTGGRFWLLKIGYNEDYRQCSPGNLLMLETLHYALKHGLRSYEFLGGTAAWTKRWTDTERATVDVEYSRSKFLHILSILGKPIRRLSR